MEADVKLRIIQKMPEEQHRQKKIQTRVKRPKRSESFQKT